MDRGGDPHRSAVWIGGPDGFLGSGFLVAQGVVVTSAHVVENSDAVSVWHAGARHDILPGNRHMFPPSSDVGPFYPYPDLAVLTVPGIAVPEHPVVECESGVPEPAARVEAIGYSTFTPAEGVQPDSLLLETAGRAGPFVRVIGDEVKGGLSGSMVVRRSTGLVCGVLKGTRDYKAVRGGWITPVTALLEVLKAVGATAEVRRAPATDQDVVNVLLKVKQLGQLQGRFDLLSIMGSLLGMSHAFVVSERSIASDHLREIVGTCRSHKDACAAWTALVSAVETLSPDHAALLELRSLVGTCRT
ncbi:trypsin-like peptidase domain-containing protein [Streptomyces sp. KL118A]|uniref:effector-associated domain 2-containing protein n=1 Tax=Streptomyces sp. KL118A TaxID=3045153 RepID=UPI00278C70FF|nr:trypsin-like peptidase domain-containing protein [Streptomyces sp. KL118A]